MAYNYTTDATQDKIVFTQPGTGGAQSLFIFLGILFFSIGCGLNLFLESADSIVWMMKFLFPLFGVLAIYTGIKLPKMKGKNTPEQIIFDNANGRVEITQQASDIQTGYIYYDEIAGFIIQKREISSDKSGFRGFIYPIYLNTKAGGQWELLVIDSQEKAEEEIANLSRLVRLDRTPRRVALKMRDSQKYRLSEGLDKTELAWRNKVGFAPVLLALFACVFLAVMYTIGTSVFSQSSLPIFAYIVFGFIGAVFLFVIGGNAWKMLKNSKTEYVIAITRHSLDYIERGLDGLDRKTTRIAIADLHSVVFSYESNTSLRTIIIYTHEQFLKKDRIGTSLSMESVKDAFHFHQELLVLDVQDMSPLEALQITQFMNQQVSQKGNRQVA
jgi:hypothetical protein